MEGEKLFEEHTALSFKRWLDSQKEFYFIGKMFIFAHSDAEAPPAVFRHRYYFFRGGSGLIWHPNFLQDKIKRRSMKAVGNLDTLQRNERAVIHS